jgi:hypothetical protein
VISRCLRKRAPDRYPDTKELTSDLRAVQREVESGISTKVPLGVRLQERLLALRDLAPSEWAWPIGIGFVAIGLLVAMVRSDGEVIPVLFMFGTFGLLLYRWIRNRRYRATKRFTSKVRRLQEVRIIAVDGLRITVVADKALARTYVRVNALVDATNAKMFFGDPFKVVVRDDLTPEETKALLTSPGVLYVREDRDGKSA